MKRALFILIPASLLGANSIRAQFSKGTLMLGTNLATTSYSNASSDYTYDAGGSKSTGTHTYSFSMGPQIGVFVTHNLVFGGTLSFSLTNSKVNTTTNNANNTTSGSKTTTTTSTVSLGPFLRAYFAGIPARNWFYFQVNGSAGTGSGSNSGTSYTPTTDGSSSGSVSNIFNWNAGGSIGMTHFFNRHVGLDLAAGYTYTHNHNYDVNNTTTTNISTGKSTSSANNYTLNTGTSGFSLGFGFHWYLERH